MKDRIKSSIETDKIMKKIYGKYKMIDKIKQELIIHLEKYISQIDYMTNEEKEEMYLKGLGLTKEDGIVIWEDNEIVGFKPDKPCEYISFKVIIDKNSTKLEL